MRCQIPPMPPSRSAKVPVPSILSPPRSSRANRDPGEPLSTPSVASSGEGPRLWGRQRSLLLHLTLTVGALSAYSPAALIHRGAPGQAERGRLPPASLRDGSFPSPQPPRIGCGQGARLQPLAALQPCVIPPFPDHPLAGGGARPAAASSNAGKRPLPRAVPGFATGGRAVAVPAPPPSPSEGWEGGAEGVLGVLVAE